MNEEGQYLSRKLNMLLTDVDSDAEPIQIKRPVRKLNVNTGLATPSNVKSIGGGGGHSATRIKAAGAAIMSDAIGTGPEHAHSALVPKEGDYTQEMKQGVNKIMVAVRCRPMWKKEKEKGEVDCVKILDRNVVILMDPADVLDQEKILGKNRTKEKQYAFDYAFDEKTP